MYKCGCQFVPTRHKERSKQEKTPCSLDVCTWLFVQTHCQIFQSQRSFGVLLGKTFAKNNYSKLVPTDDGVIIELDEMWHFLRSQKDEFGFGRPTVEPQNSSSIENVVHEILKRLEKCMSD